MGAAGMGAHAVTKYSLPSTKYERTGNFGASGRKANMTPVKQLAPRDSHDPLRDQVRELVRSLVKGLKGMIIGVSVNLEARGRRQPHDVESCAGFHVSGYAARLDELASDPLVRRTIVTLYRLLAVPNTETEPRSRGAVRRLHSSSTHC